jgi:hypothetical protein
VGVFEKLLRENNLDHESSRLSIQWLNSTPGIQPATDFSQSETTTRIDHFVEHLVCTHLNTKSEQSELPATSEMRRALDRRMTDKQNKLVTSSDRRAPRTTTGLGAMKTKKKTQP